MYRYFQFDAKKNKDLVVPPEFYCCYKQKEARNFNKRQNDSFVQQSDPLHLIAGEKLACIKILNEAIITKHVQ